MRNLASHYQPGNVSRPEGEAAEASYEEIIVFDSTGMALQDVAAASVVYQRARAAGRGIAVDLTA